MAAEPPNSTSSEFLLLNAAATAAQQCALACWTPDCDRRRDMELFYGRNLHEAIGRLAELCRVSGFDPTISPLWTLIPPTARFDYDCRYNQGLVVELQVITPKSIFDGLGRGNVLRYEGWIMKGRCDEADDAFGLPGWHIMVQARSPIGNTEDFGILSRGMARAVYEHVIGHPFAGDDGLGVDPLHPAEGMYPLATSDD